MISKNLSQLLGNSRKQIPFEETTKKNKFGWLKLILFIIPKVLGRFQNKINTQNLITFFFFFFFVFCFFFFIYFVSICIFIFFLLYFLFIFFFLYYFFIFLFFLYFTFYIYFKCAEKNKKKKKKKKKKCRTLQSPVDQN